MSGGAADGAAARACLQAVLLVGGSVCGAVLLDDAVAATAAAPGLARGLRTRLAGAQRTTWPRMRGRVAASGDAGVALALDAAALDAPTAAAFEQHGQRWLWHAPLRHRGRLHGCLVLAMAQRRAPAKAARTTIAALGRQFMAAHHGAAGDGAARARLDEMSRAAEVLHGAIAELDASALPSFLDTLLQQALQATGAVHGAVVLMDGALRHDHADHVCIVQNGRIVSSAEKRALGIERVPVGDAARRVAEEMARLPDGCLSRPEDPQYEGPMRGYLESLGLRNIVSIALRVGDRVIGCLAAGYFDLEPLPPDRLALLRLLAGVVAMAVELTRAAALAQHAAVEHERAETAESRIGELLRANKSLTGAIGVWTPRPAMETVLRTTLASICEPLIGGGVGTLWLADADTGVQRRHIACIDGRVVTGAESGLPDGGGDMPLGKVMSDPRFLHGDPFPLTLAELPDKRRRVMRRQRCDRMMVFPMALAGRAVGGFFLMLPAARPDPRAEDLRFAQALAEQALLTLELMRLAEGASRMALAREREAAAQARAGELARANGALKQALDVISDDLDIGDTLGRLLVVVCEQLGCTQATLCLRDEEAATFRAVAVVDGALHAALPQPGVDHLCPPADSRLWSELIESRRTLVRDRGVAGAPVHAADAWLRGTGAHSLLVVPLVQRGAVIGCLTFRFDRQRPYTAAELELAQTLAHQATLAVQLERLARAAERKSRHAATLAERARIARDLHDTLAQGLTGILMHLQASQRTREAGHAAAHVQEALEAARGALVDASRSVYALRSMTNERAELLPALKGVLRTTFAGSDVATDVAGDVRATRLSENAENELLRIAQEAATNALKHARASRFHAFVARQGDAIELWLSDDGAGFEPEAPRDGFGLVGMAERAERIGAGLHITSRPGAGTRIVVRVPAGG